MKLTLGEVAQLGGGAAAAGSPALVLCPPGTLPDGRGPVSWNWDEARGPRAIRARGGR